MVGFSLPRAAAVSDMMGPSETTETIEYEDGRLTDPHPNPLPEGEGVRQTERKPDHDALQDDPALCPLRRDLPRHCRLLASFFQLAAIRPQNCDRDPLQKGHPTMLTLIVRYARYALTALSTVAFALAPN